MIVNLPRYPLSKYPLLALNHISLLSDFGEPFYHYTFSITEREDSINNFIEAIDQKLRQDNIVFIWWAEPANNNKIIIHFVINITLKLGLILTEKNTPVGQPKSIMRLEEEEVLKAHYLLRMGQIIMKLINSTWDGDDSHMDVHISFPLT